MKFTASSNNPCYEQNYVFQVLTAVKAVLWTFWWKIWVVLTLEFHIHSTKRKVYTLVILLSLSNITLLHFFVKMFAEIKDFNIWGETFQRIYFLGGLNYLTLTLYKPIKKTPKDLNEASLWCRYQLWFRGYQDWSG